MKRKLILSYIILKITNEKVIKGVFGYRLIVEN